MKQDDLERLARRRAGMKMGWYLHASVYMLVNLFLFAIAQQTGHPNGRSWAVFPALGWGLGLFIHGAVVFLHGSGLFDRLVDRERERMGLGPRP